MLKKLYTILLALVILNVAVFAQSKVRKEVKPKFLNEKIAQSSFYSDYMNAKSARLAKTNAAAQDVMFANYDWPANSYMHTALVMYDITGDGKLDPVAVETHNSPTRYAILGYIDDFGANSYPVAGINDQAAIKRTGWNNEISSFDPATGKVYVGMYDFLNPDGNLNNHIYEVDLSVDPTVATKISADGAMVGSWPRYAKTNDGNWWYFAQITGSDYEMWKSTNNGGSWDSIGTVGQGDAKFWGQDGASNDPNLATNGTKISFFTTLAKAGDLNTFFEGDVADPDSADGIYHWYSTDMGANWKGEMVHIDGSNAITNRDYYARLESFDMGHYIVDGVGTSHFVHGGANTVTIVGPDTILANSLFYWNDKDKEWIALSNYAVDTCTINGDLDPGNMYGNNRPTVTASADGKLVAVLWTAPEFAGAPGVGAPNEYPGDGGAQSAVVNYMDTWWAYSTDGGKTFSEAAILLGDKMSHDVYPFPAYPIETKDGIATVHYLFNHDPIPGTSLSFLAQNSASADQVWRYDAVTFNYVVDIEDDQLVKNYKLEQNYPNPFNPSTSISFTLAQKGNVSLKVFDVLGKEVANLANGELEAGNHSIDFNASNLASGMYLYTLKAGNFNVTKKMMLMK